MKKLLVFILILSGLASLAQAQYKPEKGNFTTELQLSLFSINAKVDYDGETVSYSNGPLSMAGFRFRYFFSDKLAFRTTIGFNFDHDKTVRNIDGTYAYYLDDSYYSFKALVTGERTEKNRYTTFSIAPGLEYHFGDWERMSLYVGGEVLFGMMTSKSTVEENADAMLYTTYYGSEDYWGIAHTEASIETKNCRSEYGGYSNKYTQNAPMFFGFNAIFGMDFYIYKSLYMGAELGLGYAFETYLKGSYKETTLTVIAPDGGTPIIKHDTPVDEKLDNKMSSGNFGFRYNPMIRLGWRF